MIFQKELYFSKIAPSSYTANKMNQLGKFNLRDHTIQEEFKSLLDSSVNKHRASLSRPHSSMIIQQNNHDQACSGNMIDFLSVD